MMKELKEIRDDQIRIIGEGESKNPLPRNVRIILLSILGIAVIGVIILLCSDHIKTTWTSLVWACKIA